MKQETRGRKKKYGVKTTTVTVRVPEDKVQEVKALINKKLDKLKTNK